MLTGNAASTRSVGVERVKHVLGLVDHDDRRLAGRLRRAGDVRHDDVSPLGEARAGIELAQQRRARMELLGERLLRRLVAERLQLRALHHVASGSASNGPATSASLSV